MAASVFSRLYRGIKRRVYALALSCAIAGIFLPATLERCSEVWNRPTNWGHNAAADARRIFLAGIAARMGLDPTQPESLMQAYETEAAQKVPLNMPTQHRAGKYSDFATMYPATLAPLMMPFAQHSWTWFLYWWRYILFGTFCLGVFAAGLGAAKGRWAPIGGVLALYMAMSTPHDILDIALRIGQANLFVAGVFGVVMGVTAFGFFRVGITVSLFGACVKLVPAVALGPIGLRLAAKDCLWLLIVMAVILFGVAQWTPLERFFEDLTLIAGQQKLARSHLLVNSDSTLLFLERIRLVPMGAFSLLSIALALWRVRKYPHKTAEVISTGVALMSLWIGTAAAAIMDHYSILLVPGMLFVGLWPLREKSPWWALFFLPVLFGPSMLIPRMVSGYHELIFIFALGGAVWGLCLCQLALVTKK